MAAVGNGGGSPNSGVSDQEWARYATCVERQDREEQHALTSLIVANGLLLITLGLVANAGFGSRAEALPELSKALTILVPWLGLVASACLFSQLHLGVEYRRSMEQQWRADHPDAFPAPFGRPVEEDGPIGFTARPLAALLSGIFWLVLPAVMLAWDLAPWHSVRTTDLGIASIFCLGLQIITGLVALAWLGAHESGKASTDEAN